MSREEDLGAFQMLWDCSACETPKLLGLTHRHCPNCGSAQDPDRRYFPPEGEEIAAGDHPYAGADLRCPACETPMSASASNCGGCGSPLEGGKGVNLRAEQSGDAQGRFAEDSARAARDERKAARQAASSAKSASHRSGAASAPKAPGSNKSRTGLFIGLGVLALVVVIVLSLTFWTKSVDVVARAHAWKRTVDVERYGPVSRTAWKQKVPSGAYGLACSREVKSHKKVPDGEE